MVSPREPLELRRLRRLGLLALLVILLMLLWPNLESFWIRMTATPRPIVPRGDLSAEEHTTIEIFRKASPSVVYITTLTGYVNPWTRNVTEVRQGTGSGFIWDEQGHVVTNYHVVEKTSTAYVRLNDHRVYKAVTVGASPEHDLAVLRISVPFNPPLPVPVGTSGDMQVGQKVFAIGNPFGLDYTLTTGIVSALNRSLKTDSGSTIDDLIQTDAAINPGNSGGPLIDSAGRLIGITTAIYSPSGAYAGIGFAIPVDTVNRVVPQLIASGHYVRPTLRIRVSEDINRAVTKELGVPGVVVLSVAPGSAAAEAGLRGSRVDTDGNLIPGDIVQAIDGHPVFDVEDLLSLLDNYDIGDRVMVMLYRDGEVREIPIVLEGPK